MAHYEEYNLQKSICRYLEVKYSDVLFLSDSISNIALTPTQQARNKAIQKRDFSAPDLAIFAPRGNYHGLFLELKVESPFKKDGTLRAQTVTVKKNGMVVDKYDHLKEQDRALRMLRGLGYKAEFCWSIDQAMKIIDEYLNQ